MATNHSLFQRVPVEVPNMSGFDMSHENCFTALTGRITPAMVDELLPKDHVSLGVNCQIQTVPFATDFYGTIEAKFEAFFVPNRILFGGWQSFITCPPIDTIYPGDGSTTPSGSQNNNSDDPQPTVLPTGTFPLYLFGPNTLADYLDIQYNRPVIDLLGSNNSIEFSPGDGLFSIPGLSMLPFLAYHKIYDDWYRDSRIQYPLFVKAAPTSTNSSVATNPFFGVKYLPSAVNPSSVITYIDYDKVNTLFATYVNTWLASAANLEYSDDADGIAALENDLANGSLEIFRLMGLNRTGALGSTTRSAMTMVYDTFRLNDGVSIFSLRQRNWQRDYFTAATLTPQSGNPARVSFQVSSTVSGSSATGIGSFSIAALRAANHIQHFLEVNNYAGDRYGDQIRAQFGIYPSDATTQRALYLGSCTVPVYTKAVYAQSEVDPSSVDDRNPFATVGTKFGNAQGIGSGSLVDSFTASEHGFLMVMFTLVPHAFYGTGTHKRNNRLKIGDFAFPNLAGVGDESIRLSEIWAYPNSSTGIFGYTQRYASYKYKNDAVHGLLRDGESLSAFALKRSFVDNIAPNLSTSFLEIPVDFLDDVTAVQESSSKFGCWVDCHFSYKKVSTLPAYSIPTLAEAVNTHTEMIPNGGTRL